MTTKYRSMVLSGWGVSGGVWEEFTDDDLMQRYGPERAAEVLQMHRDDVQSYIEIERNGDWRPYSTRSVPAWEHASSLGISNIEGQAGILRRQAGSRYRQQAEALIPLLAALKLAEDHVREQKQRVNNAEKALAEANTRAAALETEAAAKRKDLDKRLAVFDAATSPKTVEAVTV